MASRSRTKEPGGTSTSNTHYPVIFESCNRRTAIVDRLTFNGTIIETGTDSYRLAQQEI